MKFEMFGRVFDIRNIDTGNRKISPHTDEERESMSIYFDIVGDETNKIIQDNLSDAEEGNIFSLTDDEVKLKEYKLINSSYNHNTNPFDSITVYNYRFDLEEVEKLAIESLVIGQTEVSPYDYEEEYIEERDALIITGKIDVSKETMQELSKMYDEHSYFDVVRKGISDKKLQMRFEPGVWSEKGDRIKQELILVEKSYDEKPESMSFPQEPTLSNMKDMLAQVKSENDALINLLVTKEIVSEDEINEIKKNSAANYEKTMRDFYKVEDLDEV